MPRRCVGAQVGEPHVGRGTDRQPAAVGADLQAVRRLVGKDRDVVGVAQAVTAHLPEAWVLGYDLYPLDTMAAKKQFVPEAIDKQMLIFFEHDPEIATGYFQEENGKWRVRLEP